MDYEITPHHGIGPVKLGMGREKVNGILGSENYNGSNGVIDYYFDNALQIEFEDNIAEFIGISYHPNYTVTYKGVNVFNTEAKELFELIASNEDEKHEYDSLEYLFPNQIVTLWGADEQYDQISSGSRLIWAQVGIGTQRYLQSVS